MKNTMLKVSEMENEKESFKLIPISLDCPYIEARFNLQAKILTIMSKEKFEEFRMLPKLDENGNPASSKINKNGVKYERLRVNSFYDYSISNKKDIEQFVDLITGEPHNLSSYFIVEEKPKQPSNGTVNLEESKATALSKNGK